MSDLVSHSVDDSAWTTVFGGRRFCAGDRQFVGAMDLYGDFVYAKNLVNAIGDLVILHPP